MLLFSAVTLKDQPYDPISHVVTLLKLLINANDITSVLDQGGQS